jgi:hypothetical protein
VPGFLQSFQQTACRTSSQASTAFFRFLNPLNSEYCLQWKAKGPKFFSVAGRLYFTQILGVWMLGSVKAVKCLLSAGSA